MKNYFENQESIIPVIDQDILNATNEHLLDKNKLSDEYLGKRIFFYFLQRLPTETESLISTEYESESEKIFITEFKCASGDQLNEITDNYTFTGEYSNEIYPIFQQSRT
jgi:hypothetical protein